MSEVETWFHSGLNVNREHVEITQFKRKPEPVTPQRLDIIMGAGDMRRPNWERLSRAERTYVNGVLQVY